MCKNLIIVDDHEIMIDGLTSLLDNTEFNIVNSFTNPQLALEWLSANSSKVQIVLLDISMPVLNGIDLCKQIKKMDSNIKVLMLSMYNSGPSIIESIEAEADGFLVKSTGKSQLLTALHKIANDGTFFSDEVLPYLLSQFNKEQKTYDNLSLLTKREIEIIKLICEENTSDDIGKLLFISKKTVDNHRANILEKLHIKSTIGLVKFAVENEIIK